MLFAVWQIRLPINNTKLYLLFMKFWWLDWVFGHQDPWSWWDKFIHESIIFQNCTIVHIFYIIFIFLNTYLIHIRLELMKIFWYMKHFHFMKLKLTIIWNWDLERWLFILDIFLSLIWKCHKTCLRCSCLRCCYPSVPGCFLHLSM